ncbi:hypothetical protein [Terracoccus sp. 273MFTsu3.1]|uniref:hypothetical protein n=1 Tax=Terracoccus sp. 273MFTsu3.1 TaxID=1172188 RepID=UPI0003AA43A2|nr:hypothetical protein [Terracoccus sp. 273MFTsu3.1]
MSETPPHEPDPTRDTTGDVGPDPTDLRDGSTGAGGRDPSGPADPADLPTEPGTREGATAYDTTFGLEPPPATSWVPQKVGADHASPPPPPAAPTSPPVTERLRTVTLPGAAGRSLGGRLQAWHVVAIVVGLLVPLGFWASTSLVDDLDPVARPAISVTRNRPAVTRTFPVPTITPQVPGASPTRSVPGATARPTTPTRGVMTSPPTLIPVPAVPVTPVPSNARTIRFEAYAETGARIEVSLSDATHQRHDYPAQTAPLAFEVPVRPGATSNDYFSLRVRTSDPTGSGVRGAVSCRVLVDGIVVTAQQGQGYATCYISPYFDIQRR